MIIAFSGIDGSGKTTLAKYCTDYLKKKGYEARYDYCGDYFVLNHLVKLFHKIHGAKTGSKPKRNPFLGRKKRPYIFQLWIFLTLFDSILHNIWLRIRHGNSITVCDRYAYDRIAGLAYNGYSNPVFSAIALRCIPKPDIHFVLTAEKKTAQKRERNNYHSLEFFRIQSRFFQSLIKYRKNIRVLNTDQPLIESRSALSDIIDMHTLPDHKLRHFLTPYIIIPIVVLFAFRRFASSGFLYTTWDFTFPLSYQQVFSRLTLSLSSYDPRFALGSADSMQSFYLYWWVYILPFVFVFGIYAVKVLIIFLACTGWVFMYRLLSYAGLKRVIAFVFGLLYIFNPYFYSRVTAGHLNAAAAVAFLPGYILVLHKFLRDTDFRVYHLALVMVLFIFSSMHPMALGITIITTVIISIYEIIRKRSLLVLLRFVVTGLLLVLIHAHIIIPMVSRYSAGQSYYKGGSEVREEMVIRDFIANGSKSPLYFPMLFYNRIGLDTEYAFPVQKNVLWLSVQPLFAILVLLAVIKLRDRKTFMTFGSYIFFSALTSGYGNPIGEFLYEKLIKNINIVFFEYANSNRFLSLVIISGVSCFAFGADKAVRHFHKNKTSIIAVLCLAIAIRTWPYFDNSLFKQSDYPGLPFSFLSNEYTPETESMLSIVNTKSSDRVGLLPPFQIAPVGIESMNWGTQALHGFSGDFFNGHSLYQPFHWFVTYLVSNPDIKTHKLGQLLGLANVEKIIVPQYESYGYSTSFGRKRVTNPTASLYDSENAVMITLTEQEDLKKLVGDYPLIFRNMDNQPKIKGFNSTVLIVGGYDMLLDLVNKGVIDLDKEIPLFAKTASLEFLSQLTRIIYEPLKLTDLTVRYVDDRSKASIMSDQTKNVMRNFQGEYPIISIPDKEKGIFLKEGTYNLTNNLHSVDQNVIVIKPVFHKNSHVTINGITVCGAGIDDCTAEVVVIPDQPDNSELSIQGEGVAIEYIYIVPRSMWTNAEDKTRQLLSDYPEKFGIDSYISAFIPKSGQSDVKSDNTIVFNQSRESEYSLTSMGKYTYIYVANSFDPNWKLVGKTRTYNPVPAGAGGLLYMPDYEHGEKFKLIYGTQKYVDIGKKIMITAWITVAAVMFVSAGYLRMRKQSFSR